MCVEAVKLFDYPSLLRCVYRIHLIAFSADFLFDIQLLTFLLLSPN